MTASPRGMAAPDRLARLEHQAAEERRELILRLRNLSATTTGPRRGWKPLAAALLLRRVLALVAGAQALPGPLRALLVLQLGVAVLRRVSRGRSVVRRR